MHVCTGDSLTAQTAAPTVIWLPSTSRPATTERRYFLAPHDAPRGQDGGGGWSITAADSSNDNIGKHQQQESHFFVIPTNVNGIERLLVTQQPRRCLIHVPLVLAVWIVFAACRISLFALAIRFGIFGIFGPTFALRPQPLSTIDECHKLRHRSRDDSDSDDNAAAAAAAADVDADGIVITIITVPRACEFGIGMIMVEMRLRCDFERGGDDSRMHARAPPDASTRDSHIIHLLALATTTRRL
jgi:hypothetical protein